MVIRLCSVCPSIFGISLFGNEDVQVVTQERHLE